jgi:NADH:ubiquinone oxidoreductase subunit 3 (subunit A)
MIAPFIFDIDCFSGGCAMAFLCFFLTIIGVVIAIIYQRRATALDKILYGKDLLARWSYSTDEWTRYAAAEYKRERKGKQALFIVITVISLIIALGFVIFDRTVAGLWVLAAMGGLIALIAFVAYFTPWYNYRQNLKYPGEVLIAPNGAYFSRQLHIWDQLGARLVRVELKEAKQPYIEFVYEAPTRTGMQEYEARVPVPQGKDKEARELADKFADIVGRG